MTDQITRPPTSESPNTMERLVEEYLRARNIRETTLKVENNYKETIKDRIESAAEAGDATTDEKGSQFMELGRPIFNPIREEDVLLVKREKRVSQSLNEEAAIEVLDELGLKDKCLTQITVLDEEAILALNFSEQISDEDLARMYEKKTTWALKI